MENFPFHHTRAFPDYPLVCINYKAGNNFIKDIFKLLTLFCCVGGRLCLQALVNMANF